MVSSVNSSIVNSLSLGRFDVGNLANTLAQADFGGRLALVNSKVENLTLKSNAIDTLKSAMSGFSEQIKNLQNFDNSFKINSSDSSITTKINDSSKLTNFSSLDVEVMQLAKSTSISSQSFSNSTAIVGSGKLSIQVGGAKTDINIDGSNNSLSGIRDAINKSNAGVSASIINDSKGSYLVVNGKTTGESSAVSISVEDLDGNNTDNAGLSSLVSNMSVNQTAQDALVKVNGMQISSSSNNFKNTIDGLDFTVSKQGVTSTLNAENASTDFKKNIQNFVDYFNDLDNVVKTLGSYSTGENPLQGSLKGTALIRDLKNQINNIVKSPNPNGGAYSMLSEIGIQSDRNGQLTIDEQKLDVALNNNINDVKKLFSSSISGQNDIVYKNSNSKTSSGNFTLNINQVASQAKISGSSIGGTGSDQVLLNNMAIQIVTNGGSSVNLLLNGDFTKDSLARKIQDSVNSLAPDKIDVMFNNNTGQFEFYTQEFGSSQKIEIKNTDAQANSLGINDSIANGQDVAGFLQGQNNYIFSGKGQNVTINSFLEGSPQGLNFDYKGLSTGNLGSMSYNQGVADKIINSFNSIMSDNGLLGQTQNSYSKTIKALQSQQNKLQTGQEQAVTRYTAQFSKANQIIADLSNIGSSLGANFNQNA